MTSRLALLAISLAGCNLYFGGDDDIPPCAYGNGTDAVSAEYLRNPQNGACEAHGGGGYPCDDACGPCPDIGVAASPDWGACHSECTALGEAACVTTPGCYAAYLDDPMADGPPGFWACWDVAPSGPVGGSCANLSAYECSRRDRCSAVYNAGGPSFAACVEERVAYCQSDEECGTGGHCDMTVCHPPPGCDPNCANCGACPAVCYGVCEPKQPTSCADVDCGPGYHCEEQCSTNTDPTWPTACGPVCVGNATCAVIDCAPGYSCAQVCEVDANGQLRCEATCVPDPNDPGQCHGTVLCDMVAPACPSGTVPGVKNGCYTGYCIPVEACGPSDPGECYGTVVCNALPPACPSGTVPGVANGCWTGYCIPQAHCPMPACETLASEQACVARGDCTPVYDGHDCTCYPSHCECQTLTYARCESSLVPH